MSNVIELRSRRPSVTYTIHVTQHADGEIETYVEDVDDDPDTDEVMRLLDMIVHTHKLAKYAAYIEANMPDVDDK